MLMMMLIITVSAKHNSDNGMIGLQCVAVPNRT
jgi:hypothetical protein